MDAIYKSIFKKMPAFQFSIDAVLSLGDYHTEAEFYRIILAIANYYRNGIEPEGLTEQEMKGYNSLMRYTNAEAEEYANRILGNRKGAQITNEIKAEKKAAEEEKKEKVAKKAITNRENGKKGGRPRKGETAEEARKRKEQDIEPNLDFENEVSEQHSNTSIKPIYNPIEASQQNFYTTPPPESSQGLEEPLMDFRGNQFFMEETYNSFINNNAI